jgi:glutaredoxin 3
VSAKIEVYTTTYCPYCHAAKDLLRGKGVAFEEFDLTNDAEGRANLVKRSNGLRTVPQIFINGKHIGGFDALSALDASGKLDPLLR